MSFLHRRSSHGIATHGTSASEIALPGTIPFPPAVENIHVAGSPPTISFIRKTSAGTIIRRVSTLLSGKKKVQFKPAFAPLNVEAASPIVPLQSRWTVVDDDSSESDVSFDDIRRPSGLGRSVSFSSNRSLPPSPFTPIPEDSPFHPSTKLGVERLRSMSSPNPPRGTGTAMTLPVPSASMSRRNKDCPPPPMPYEVVVNILTFTPQHAVASHARVSRDWSTAARPVLYSKLDLGTLRPKQVESLVTLLAYRHDLTDLVRSFECHTWPDFFPPSSEKAAHATHPSFSPALTAVFTIAFQNMHHITSLVLPSFDNTFLRHHSAFGLRSFTILSNTMTADEITKLFAWLDGQTNITNLAFPNLLDSDNTSTDLSLTIPKSPHFPDSTHTDSLNTNTSSSLRTSSPISPFIPLTPNTPTSPFNSLNLLPALTTLVATPFIVTSLITARPTSVPRPLQHVTLVINNTLYTGLRPTALLSIMHGITSLTLKFGAAVDRRTIGKVLSAAALLSVPPTTTGSSSSSATETIGSDVSYSKDLLQHLEMQLSDSTPGADVALYKMISSSISRYKGIMRAANQQDLIYKRGTAGVTKASVTIVFDNSDKSKSPAGYQEYKQITVTRQIALPNVSKYLLNGHKSTQQNVQTMFQSVQLNINNPNFVIMQGRITKVLNMRPQEILGMVEEAAGTRMFEERKDKALKTMAKKDKRVQEILSILREEIAPKLEKLRKEKRSFIEYQKSVSELEKIARVLRAWEWTEAQDRVRQKEEEITEKQEEIQAVKQKTEKRLKEIKVAEKEVEAVTKKRDSEIAKGGKLKKLEDAVQELGKVAFKMKTQVEIKEGTIKDEDTNIKVLIEQSKEVCTLSRNIDIPFTFGQLQNSLEEKHTQFEALNTSFKTVNDQHQASATKLATAEELLQTLLTGLSSGTATTSGGGYMGQLAAAKGRIAQGQAEEEQSKVKLGMSEKELKALEARWKEVERDARDGQKTLQAKRAAVEDCRKKLEKCNWNGEKERSGEESLKNAKAKVRGLTEEHERVRQSLGRIDFEYSDPYPNFDRRKVKGQAATLITLPKEHHHKSTALEIAAGGKLFQVVVENEKVGSDIIKNGKLKKRVTLIPLNKISAFRLSQKQIDAAQRLAPGKVRPALSLVTYDDEVANAIAYVFSDNFICDDAESAKRVTFSREVGVRSVTLDGDVYDPSGTLSGGSAPSGSGILVRVQALLAVGVQLSEAREELEALEDDETRTRKVREEWRQLCRELEMKEHEAKLMEEQVEGSNASRIGSQVQDLKKIITDLRNAVQTAKDKVKEAEDECKKLERDMAEFKNNKEGKTEELKKDILKQKAALQRHAVTVKTQQKEVQTAKLELEQIEQDIQAAANTLKDAEKGVTKLQRDLVKLKEDFAAKEAAHIEAERKLQEERATLSRFDNELKELANVIKEKKQANSEAELQIKSLEHSVQTLGKEKTTAANHVTNLEKLHEWIAEEKHQFCVAGTPYDFKSQDMEQMKAKAVQLEESQKGMKKKVNPKVMNMIDNVEKREADTQKMLSTVMKDKEKIEDTIEELDRYKRDALQKTWEKVNGDFGGIFAELLPGNFAKLQPPEGQDLMDGLEVKVQLGSVWKQSLTELSGGQRSLIALSLIMALLQFKPAPMYILDEIDAALDLSHTQHIGQLFKTRFKGSQFIVVSLKEGLFTNANVLFRARFRDGTSVVERTADRSASTLYDGSGNSLDDRTTRRHRAG
ncbi:hypothetical protein H0H92_005336 [Tricholoma furcatifolium]|nr:hypothetical protein H0H92_005336 [Tricholoma furcatifolium]